MSARHIERPDPSVTDETSLKPETPHLPACMPKNFALSFPIAQKPFRERGKRKGKQCWS